jgi:hypothetical protein
MYFALCLFIPLCALRCKERAISHDASEKARCSLHFFYISAAFIMPRGDINFVTQNKHCMALVADIFLALKLSLFEKRGMRGWLKQDERRKIKIHEMRRHCAGCWLHFLIKRGFDAF